MASPEIVVPAMVFGLPVAIVFIRTYFGFRKRQLELMAEGGQSPKLLQAAQQEREKRERELEARIQNLESIVCSVDYELNDRLNRLLAQSPEVGTAATLHAGAQIAGIPGAAALPGQLAGGTAARALAGGATGRNPAQLMAPLGQLGVGQVVLGRYTVRRELGRGGMGAVYLAEDAQLGGEVALKTIAPSTRAEPEALTASIRREVQAARRVTHPHVIRIHDLHEDGPLLFLSMEYIPGETLWARVQKGGALPLASALALLSSLCDGVAAAHAAGVVHRDLKPQNVLLSELAGVSGDGARRPLAPKIIDFGLASATGNHLTRATGIILGTPEYMAPEQVRGGPLDARTDVYALGAIAYFVLCGRPPFSGESPIAVAFAQVHDEPAPPRTLRPELPAAVEAALLRSLSKDPGQRFASAAALGEALIRAAPPAG